MYAEWTSEPRNLQNWGKEDVMKADNKSIGQERGGDEKIGARQ
jgi:hypothetical protein